MTRAWMLAVLIAAAPQTTPSAGAVGSSLPFLPQTLVNPAQPIVDLALRQIRAGTGGSSIARSAVRGGEPAVVYAGLGPCVVGAAATDPARPNSVSWRASGRVTLVEHGMAFADVEWQRIDYRLDGVTAGPRVRMTLALPFGERLAVDFVDTAGSACRTDALIFEIGIAADHGTRLSMSSEGRSLTTATASGRGGGGAGVGGGLPADQAVFDSDRQRLGEDAARAAPTISRPMPPREYQVDLWLLSAAPGSVASAMLAQRMSKPIGGTGGRFEFPPDMPAGNSGVAGAVDVSALVIPVDGERVVVAITRQYTPADGTAPVSNGWVKAVRLPKADAILSFEIPAADAAGTGARSGREGYSLRMKIVRK